VSDRAFMLRAIEIARWNVGLTKPNPATGAVLVDREGNIIGEGANRYADDEDAEVHAIRNAVADTVDATLYVTLEPVCPELILRRRIRRVVAAVLDRQNANGATLQALRKSGLQVLVGVCRDQAKALHQLSVYDETFEDVSSPFEAQKR
jgi:diaminohydroxyphosphoribosylaminopyrimidine deaminase/5-amino-6-(5-phosphoribosylamino)uracil reductase